MIVADSCVQLHHRADLLCLLLGADDATAPSAGEEGGLWSGEV